MNSNETWAALEAAAIQYAASRDIFDGKALREAATADARARYIEKTGKGGAPEKSTAKSSIVLPYGKEKGVSLHEAKTNNLQWVLSTTRENIDNPEKARYRAQNVELADAIEAELATR